MRFDKGNIRCSVTVMPVYMDKIGFIKRDYDDSYHNTLVAPGGGVEVDDGDLVEGVRYNSVEKAGTREMREKTGIKVSKHQLRYFCSLTLPNGTMVISLYCVLNTTQVARSYNFLEFLRYDDILARTDFAPGMKDESLALLKELMS